MQSNELRNKSVAELKEELANLNREQFNLRFQLKTAQLSVASSIRFTERL